MFSIYILHLTYINYYDELAVSSVDLYNNINIYKIYFSILKGIRLNLQSYIAPNIAYSSYIYIYSPINTFVRNLI